MAAVNGDHSFVLAVVNGSWTRMQPNPADATIPKTAAIKLLLQNIGSGTIYIIKRTHDSGGTPTVALPAASTAGALADAGLVAVIEHAQDLALPAPVSALPDFLRLSDYYAWTDNAAGDPLRVWPQN